MNPTNIVPVCQGPGPSQKQPFSFMLPGQPTSTQSSALLPDTHSGSGSSLYCPTLCYFLSLLHGSSSSLVHTRKQPPIEVAIHHCGCQRDSAVFSKQRVNMPELMIMHGQCARVSGWAQCSRRELGLLEDVATALSFNTTLPSQDTGPWVCFCLKLGQGGKSVRLTRQCQPELRSFLALKQVQ